MRTVDISLVFELPDKSKVEVAGFRDYRQGTPKVRNAAEGGSLVRATKEQLSALVQDEKAALAKWPGLVQQEVRLWGREATQRVWMTPATTTRDAYASESRRPAKFTVDTSQGRVSQYRYPERKAFSGSSLGLRTFLRSAKGRFMSDDGARQIVAELNKLAGEVLRSMARQVIPPGGALTDYLEGISFHPSNNGFRIDIDGWDANAREVGWKPTAGGMDAGLGKYDGQVVDLRHVIPRDSSNTKKMPIRLEGTEADIVSMLTKNIERGRLRIGDIQRAADKSIRRSTEKMGASGDAVAARLKQITRQVKSAGQAAKLLYDSSMSFFKDGGRSSEGSEDFMRATIRTGTLYRPNFSRARNDLRAWSRSPLADAQRYKPRAESPKGTVGMVSIRTMAYDVSMDKAKPRRGPKIPPRPDPRARKYKGDEGNKEYKAALNAHRRGLAAHRAQETRRMAARISSKNKWKTAGIQGAYLAHAVMDAYKLALQMIAVGDSAPGWTKAAFQELVESQLRELGSRRALRRGKRGT